MSAAPRQPQLAAERQGRARSLALWRAGLRAAALLVLAGLGSACRESAGHGGSLGPRTDLEADSPEDLGSVGEFRLVREDGSEFGSRELLGKPWVLGCIFTSCAGPCPALTSGMAELQRELAGTQVHFVSLTVDPTHDSPERLRAYGERYGADFTSWSFLTGAEAEIYRLIRAGFRLAAEGRGADAADPQAPPTHDERLAVVDAQGRVRGYYSGRTAEGRAATAARLRFLAGAGS